MADHRRTARHTEPSEEDEINHMEETKYRRAAALGSVSFMPSSSVRHPYGRSNHSDEISSNRGGYLAKMKYTMGPSTIHSQPWSVQRSDLAVEKSKLLEPKREQRIHPILDMGEPIRVTEEEEYFQPFGISISVCDGITTSSGDEDKDKKPRMQILSALFHLDSTNIMVKSIYGTLSLITLLGALKNTFDKSNVDILDFVHFHAAYECSFHEGNRFMSFFVRVFAPPSRSSGQLLDEEATIVEKIEGGLLVEVQLREGDRLHFSALYREMMTNFMRCQEDVTITGTLRYRPKPSPGKGEGLMIEPSSFPHPSKYGTRQRFKSTDVPESPLSNEPMDEDMVEDVVKLAEMLESGLLDVQADAATAIAGLSGEAEFREQLCHPIAKTAAVTLCRAAARLLVKTEYRPARRQAAVTVANLSSSPELCLLLLDPDPSTTATKRGLVEALVTLAIQQSKDAKEEEIGTRRECMRALVYIAKSRSANNTRAMESLLSATPSGKGATCKKLVDRLNECREVLTSKN